MHSWDLAKALGREPDLGRSAAARRWRPCEPIEQLLRDSGQFGPAVPVADDASPQDKLVAFIGRDPAWQPAGAGVARGRLNPPEPGRAATCLVRVVLEEGDQLLRRPGDVQRHDRHRPVGPPVVQVDRELPGGPGGQRAEAGVVAVVLDLHLDQPRVGQVRGEFLELGSAPSSGSGASACMG